MRTGESCVIRRYGSCSRDKATHYRCPVLLHRIGRRAAFRRRPERFAVLGALLIHRRQSILRLCLCRNDYSHGAEPGCPKDTLQSVTLSYPPTGNRSSFRIRSRD